MRMCGTWSGIDNRNWLVDELAAADQPIERILENARDAMGVLRAADEHRVAAV